jgi:hypothetical protein
MNAGPLCGKFSAPMMVVRAKILVAMVPARPTKLMASPA